MTPQIISLSVLKIGMNSLLVVLPWCKKICVLTGCFYFSAVQCSVECRVQTQMSRSTRKNCPKGRNSSLIQLTEELYSVLHNIFTELSCTLYLTILWFKYPQNWNIFWQKCFVPHCNFSQKSNILYCSQNCNVVFYKCC